MKINYGECPCGGTYENRTVEVTMTINDHMVVLSDIPQGVCPNCNSRVYKTQILEIIEGVLKHPSAV